MNNRGAFDLTRRAFLSRCAGAAALSTVWPTSSPAQPAPAWNEGQLAHLIPAASHERFLIKASFRSPLTGGTRLTVNGRDIDGVQTDLQGRFWRFDAIGLRPSKQYELRITDAGGTPLCDTWPQRHSLRRMPPPRRCGFSPIPVPAAMTASRSRERPFIWT